MVNGNQQYLQDLYDQVESIQDGWEMQESAEEALPVEPYTETYQFENGSLQRVGGQLYFYNKQSLDYWATSC